MKLLNTREAFLNLLVWAKEWIEKYLSDKRQEVIEDEHAQIARAPRAVATNKYGRVQYPERATDTSRTPKAPRPD